MQRATKLSLLHEQLLFIHDGYRITWNYLSLTSSRHYVGRVRRKQIAAVACEASNVSWPC